VEELAAASDTECRILGMRFCGFALNLPPRPSKGGEMTGERTPAVGGKRVVACGRIGEARIGDDVVARAEVSRWCLDASA
jgi:hypothetical protein